MNLRLSDLRLSARLGLLGMVLLAAAAAGAPAEPAAVKRLGIAGLSEKDAGIGVFDPSFAEDANGRIWMSYSTVVADKDFETRFNAVGTRLAVSADGGKTWDDQGPVNESKLQPLPWPHNKQHARWEYEVSRVQYDRWAKAATRWKLLSHRYLRIYDGKSPDSLPLFEHGWIELKTAPDPHGPWSTPRKLFVGKVYNDDDDNNLGKPEYRLDRLDKAMAKCPAFTEPGLLAREEGLYLALTCPTGKNDGEVVLLRCDHEFGGCVYRGPLLRDADARKLGNGYSGFSGTDLVERDGQAYVVATPTTQPGDAYHGCVFYRIESLADARVAADPVLRIDGVPGSFNGACGYAGGSSKSGVFLSQYAPGEKQKFQVFETGRHPK